MREIELRLRGTDMCLNESPSEKEGKYFNLVRLGWFARGPQ